MYGDNSTDHDADICSDRASENADGSGGKTVLGSIANAGVQ
jgi:hypothetical protein